MKPLLQKPQWGWSLQMAWRDSRGQRKILFLFMLCVAAGIGALVAVASLRDNLDGVIELQSRSLLGADLELAARQPFSAELESFAARLGGEKAREVRLRSMAFFPASGESRFVQVRAVSGRFPFYGDSETEPAGLLPGPAAHLPGSAWHTGRGVAGVVVENSLLQQLALGVGDRVRLGNLELEIIGSLLRVAGESELGGFFAPRLYVTMPDLEQTGLLTTGSIARHRLYFRFDEGLGPREKALLSEAREGLFVEEGIEYTTVESRSRNLRRVMDNIFDFLNLIGFVALVLGGIGVGGAVQVYIKEKLTTMALLRCLGASAGVTFRIYLWQIVIIGFIGSLLGSALGVGSQFLLPVFLQEFLPFPLEVSISWSAIAAGLSFGWVVAVLFALLPLLKVRGISPLLAIRASVELPPTRWPGWGGVWVMATLSSLLLGFALWQTRSTLYGLVFCLALVLVYFLLAGISLLLRAAVRRFTPEQAPYSWRLALSSLYRPGNRTVFLMVTLGMGAFLLNTLYLSRASLLDQVRLTGAEDAANIILLDVQPDQLDEVRGTLLEAGYAYRDVWPVVTMRISAMRGRTLSEWRRDPEAGIRSWVYTWEFRSSWRDSLLDNEQVIAGTFTPTHDGSEPIPVSLSENIREDFNVQLGDEIIWDVQGVPVRTMVGSVRAVDWSPGRQNFTVVFPEGSLDGAPAVYLVTLQVSTREQAAALQRLVAVQFPNVSLIDLTLIFETFREVLSRAGFVIQFMAGFTIFTGLVVLLSAIYTSRYQRAREAVLLRTMGASPGLIRKVISIEYALIGLLAGSAGTVLASVAAAALQIAVFKIPFAWNPVDALLSIAFITFATWLTGMLNVRSVLNQSPLAVLRSG